MVLSAHRSVSHQCRSMIAYLATTCGILAQLWVSDWVPFLYTGKALLAGSLPARQLLVWATLGCEADHSEHMRLTSVPQLGFLKEIARDHGVHASRMCSIHFFEDAGLWVRIQARNVNA